jgi:AGZA family xanthine/uracil permease-like MFS transporter
MANLRDLFQIQERGSTVSCEIIAGLTTFTMMSYIIVVNPAILRNAGIPVEPQTVATVLAAVFGCLLMAFYANRPFAIAPYMGENAFIAFTVCQSLGHHWHCL